MKNENPQNNTQLISINQFKKQNHAGLNYNMLRSIDYNYYNNKLVAAVIIYGKYIYTRRDVEEWWVIARGAHNYVASLFFIFYIYYFSILSFFFFFSLSLVPITFNLEIKAQRPWQSTHSTGVLSKREIFFFLFFNNTKIVVARLPS